MILILILKSLVSSVSNKVADLETFINENENSINTTLFTSVLDMMKSIESQINLQRIKRSQTGGF